MTRPKIGFIFPSSDYLYDPFKGDPHTHLQILTVIEEYYCLNVDVSLIDLRGINRDFAIYHIDECDIYLYSLYTLDIKEQIDLVNKLRTRYPKSKHIAGGPHASMFWDECSNIFDSIVIGDGEEVIVKAISDYIFKRPLQKIYSTKDRIDINEYPFPKRHYLSKSTIARPGLMTTRNNVRNKDILSTTVIFSRGCIGNCSFCTMPQIRKNTNYCGIQYRKPKYIAKEIEYLKREYNIGGISLLDEIGIPPNKKDAYEFIRAIGRTDILWKAQTRVDLMNKDIAKRIKAAGCLMMCFGVESIYQKSLDVINKGITVKQVHTAIDALKKNNIEVRLYMIMGLPQEPKDILQKTLRFIEKVNPDLVTPCLFTVRPGTDIYNNYKKFGIKQIKKDWTDTMHMYSRFGDEEPRLNFEYEDGMGLSNDAIINNYKGFLTALKEKGLNTL